MAKTITTRYDVVTGILKLPLFRRNESGVFC